MSKTGKDSKAQRCTEGPAVRRVFLGWKRPLIECAAEWLVEAGPQLACSSAEGKDPAAQFAVDLSRMTVVVPSAGVISDFLMELARAATLRKKSLFPPTMVAEGDLARSLGRFDKPGAGRLDRFLTWAGVLHSLDQPGRRQLGVRDTAPDRGEGPFLSLLSTGARLDSLIGTLASAVTTPLTCLSEDGAALVTPHESRDEFWRTLDGATREYLSRLEQSGFVDGRVAARSAAIHRNVESSAPLVLIGLLSCSPLSKAVLAAVSEPVISLIGAPEDLNNLFDSLGCPTSEWVSQQFQIPDSDLLFADNPADQTDRVLRGLSRNGSQLAPKDVCIVTEDAEAVTSMAGALGSLGVTLVQASGPRLDASRPFRLLSLIKDFVDSGHFRDWVKLVRSADMMAWLSRHRGAPSGTRSGDWLVALDRYANDRLPRKLPERWSPREESDKSILEWLDVSVRELLSIVNREGTSSLRARADDTARLLETIYAAADMATSDSRLAADCAAMRDVLQELRGVSQNLVLCVADFLKLLLWLSRKETSGVEPNTGAVCACTWRAASFCSRPIVAGLSVNEGLVFGEGVRDSELPDSLLSALGLPDRAATKSARAFTLQSLLHSRELVVLSAVRSNAAGDPLFPSGELFACGDEELIVRLAKWNERREPPITEFGVGPQVRDLPRREIDPVTSMSVTDFGVFLRSPYNFYLTKSIGLKDLGTAGEELGPREFGTLVHGALRMFGTSDASIRNSTDPEQISAFLRESLEAIVSDSFAISGPAPLPAQVAQAGARLGAFARLQAARRRAGWEILRVEWKPTASVVLDVDNVPMPLKGRIDRIDVHPDHGYALLDYKTGSQAADALRAHVRADGTWRDLQLPLYRKLAAELVGRAPLQFGYVILDADPGDSRFDPATFDEQMLAAADEVAADVVRRIRQGAFFEIGPEPPEGGVFGAIVRGLILPSESADGGETA